MEPNEAIRMAMRGIAVRPMYDVTVPIVNELPSYLHVITGTNRYRRG